MWKGIQTNWKWKFWTTPDVGFSSVLGRHTYQEQYQVCDLGLIMNCTEGFIEVTFIHFVQRICWATATLPSAYGCVTSLALFKRGSIYVWTFVQFKGLTPLDYWPVQDRLHIGLYNTLLLRYSTQCPHSLGCMPLLNNTPGQLKHILPK